MQNSEKELFIGFMSTADIPPWMKGMLFNTLKDCDKKDITEMIEELRAKKGV